MKEEGNIINCEHNFLNSISIILKTSYLLLINGLETKRGGTNTPHIAILEHKIRAESQQFIKDYVSIARLIDKTFQKHWWRAQR